MNPDNARQTLEAAVKAFESAGVKWWISCGTALGCVRDGAFIGWDNDLDVCVLADLKLIRQVLKQHGFSWRSAYGRTWKTGLQEIYSYQRHSGPESYNGWLLDISYPRRSGRVLWQRIGPNNRFEYDFSLFRSLEKKEFLGLEVFVPHPVEKYLEAHYGPDWQTPKKGWRWFHALAKSDQPVVQYQTGLTFGVFDLFHIGHLNLLRQAKQHCERLVVCVSTDNYSERTKGRRPVVPLKDRMAILDAICWTDKVDVQSSTFGKAEAIAKYHADVLFVGDDWAPETYSGEGLGVPVVYLPYTRRVSTTLLKAACQAATG